MYKKQFMTYTTIYMKKNDQTNPVGTGRAFHQIYWHLISRDVLIWFQVLLFYWSSSKAAQISCVVNPSDSLLMSYDIYMYTHISNLPGEFCVELSRKQLKHQSLIFLLFKVNMFSVWSRRISFTSTLVDPRSTWTVSKIFNELNHQPLTLAWLYTYTSCTTWNTVSTVRQVSVELDV